MRFGLFLPPFDAFAEPGRVADLAGRAEQAGWDGVFLWDHVLAAPGTAVADAWITLAAVAVATSRVRLGALVTPLSRRRPWVMARQAATLDRLSGGRLVLGVGLGDDGWREFSSFGEETEPVTRGALLDESLAVLRPLLAGEPVRHTGAHLRVDAPALAPAPVQVPLPVWAACRWPNRRPLRRAARLEGTFPIFAGPAIPPPPDPAALRRLRAELDALGAGPDHDVVVRYAPSGQEPAARAATVRSLTDAGVTWILEGFGPGQPAADVERIVAAGPPSP